MNASPTRDAILDRLTPAQRDAVVHDAGPLIVLAGPGTGKTRVIERRVAWGVVERAIEPERVLAVTFTIKAAGELRERIDGVLGASLGERVGIHTFNGLGWGLVRRFADVLGLPSRVLLADAVQMDRLIREVVLELDLFRESRGLGLDALSEQLRRAFDAMGNIGLDPEDAPAAATRAFDGAGDDAAARAAAARFADEARAYAEVTRRRLARGWLTYNDQVLLAARLLRRHADAATIVRSEIACVVVDEFQDTNPGQIEFLRLLCPPTPRADICVVGDDDQAIYAFRGADEQAFRRFASLWVGARVVTLDENFRSGAPVVDAANAIITRAGRRFRDDKVLRKGAASTAPDARLTAINLRRELDDAEPIAAMLRVAQREAAAAGVPFRWDDHAVIAATHADLERISDALRLEGIPFARETEKTFLQDPGVQDALAWARWIVRASDTGAARRVLVRPPIGLPWERAVDLEKVWAAARARADDVAYDAFLAREAAEHPSLAAALTPALARLGRLRADAAALPGSEALLRVMTTSDLAHADLLPGRARSRRVGALVALLRLARQVQTRLDPPGDLGTLLDYIDELASLRAAAPSRGLGDDDAPEFEEQGESDAGRVRLMTAHASKGLEFDCVYVPRCGSGNGYGKVRERDVWEPPASLFDPLDPRPPKDRLRDEQRRLFYVACTRAKRRLVILAKLPKTSSSGLHLFEELTRGAPPGFPLDLVTDDEVLQTAARAGIVLTPAVVGARAAADREPVDEIAERLSALERARAAGVLDVVARPGVTHAELDDARRALAHAAARLAAIAHVAAHAELPAWGATPDADPDIVALAARARREAAAGEGPLLLRPMTPPLNLSYSMIDAYTRCARCFYIRHVLRVEPPAREEAGLGELVHQVLETHFARVRAADSEGRTPPDADDLLALARAAYRRSLEDRRPPDPAVLDQLLAQLRTCAERLHDPASNILELERMVRFPYACAGHTHTMSAKIDRIDQLPDGSYRVVDYKSGEPWKRLLEPAPDDLQFGVYALALRALFGDDVQGVCEYWLLATGQRGTIPLHKINHAKVGTTIADAVDGMLRGDYPRKKDCPGDCALMPDLDPPA